MHVNKGFLLIAILTTAFLYGCGEKEEQQASSSSAANKAPAQQQAASAQSTGTGSITGTVNLLGDAPKPVALKMGADQKCDMMHPDGDVSSDIVVNDNGTLKWVFVRVTEGLGNHKYDTPSEPVLLDQMGCRYKPHVFGIMAGQGLKIRNSDETMHNIHSLPKNSRPFNLAMPRQGMEITKKFKTAESMVRIKCDVHPWMESWAGVVDNPFFAVTDDQGNFTISNLPAGTFTIEIWHEEFGTQTKSITLGDGESQATTFTLKVQA